MTTPIRRHVGDRLEAMRDAVIDLVLVGLLEWRQIGTAKNEPPR